HRFEDPHVPGASAEVSRERLADVGFVWAGVALDERLRREDHPRRADSALRAAVLDERALDRAHVAGRFDAFDRRDRRAVDLHGRDEAAVGEHPVDEDGARAALPFAAAFFGAGELAVLAKDVEEARHRARLDPLAFTIEEKRDR